MCFAGRALVYSKTLQMLFGTCADVFRMSAVKSTRGRRLKNRCGDFYLFKSNECASTRHPCREEMLKGRRTSVLNAAFCCLADFVSSVESERKLVGAVGIEPTTFGLKGSCSTTELRP